MIDTALTESEKAFFTLTTQGTRIPVDFNPVTLQLTVQNQVKAEGESTVQHVSSSSAKLELELIFDTTGTGEDVRKRTQEIEQMMSSNASTKLLPQVKFEWGAFVFEGVVDSFKQTLEFFARSGIPLRAVVGLSLSQPQYKFERQQFDRTSNVGDTLDVPDGDPFSLAAAGGDPSAARGIASANGLESLRASAGATVSVGGGISIGAAAGFSAGAGIGIGIGAGAGAGVGLQAGTAAGAALAGLRAGAAAGAEVGRNFRADALLPAAGIPAIQAGAKFDVNGKAIAVAGSSFKADVTGGVQFDEV